MGDFNATPDSDEIRWLCGRTTLGGRRVAYQDAWARANPGQPGITWAQGQRLHGDDALDASSIAASTTSS